MPKYEVRNAQFVGAEKQKKLPVTACCALSRQRALRCIGKAGLARRLRAEGVVVGQDAGGVAAGEKLRRRLAAHRDLLARLDHRLDPFQWDEPEATNQDVAQAKAIGAHGRTIGHGENVVRRYVERFGVREAQANERVGVANFVPDNARPRLAGARRIRAAQVLADLAALERDASPLARDYDRASTETASAAAAGTSTGAARSGGGHDRALGKWNASLQRLLLRGDVCLCGERVRGSTDAFGDPAERVRSFVPERIEVVRRARGETVYGERAVRNGSCGSVGAVDAEPAPGPGDAGRAGHVGERPRPRWRH